jgi:hypothetical protein
MAEVIIKEAMVQRLIPGYGFVVAESFKKTDGEMGKSYYTIWSDFKCEEGEIVNVKGLLGVKMNEYENKAGEMIQSAQASVNNATVERDAPC